MILVIWSVQNRQIYRDIKYISGCLGLGRGRLGRNGDWLLIGTFSFMNDESILVLMMVVKLCEYMLKTIEVYTLNG